MKVTFNKRKIGLLKKAAELCILCDVQMSLTFKDLNGKIISFKTGSASKNTIDSSKPDYTFNEKSYPEFFLKVKNTGKKISMESFNENFSFNNLDTDITKKLKKEYPVVTKANGAGFESSNTQMINTETQAKIENNFLFESPFQQPEFGMGDMGPPAYSLRSRGYSRRQTFSFDFNNTPGFLFSGSGAQRTERGNTITRSRLSSNDLNHYLQ